jgi:hypothetical protein
MKTLAMSWSTEDGRLVCHWSESEDERCDAAVPVNELFGAAVLNIEIQDALVGSGEVPVPPPMVSLRTEGEISMPRNSPVIDSSPKNRFYTPIGKSLLSLAAFSIKLLLLLAAFFVLFLQVKAQVQSWQHKEANFVSVDGVLLP